MLTEQDWQIRLHIYTYFVENGHPPTPAETARHFAISVEQARQIYHRLHDHHTLFLEPGTDTIRMASPLSAVPTDYRISVNGRWLWANCAWDSLGIPAMLNSDALINATFAHSREPITYQVKDGTLKGDGGADIGIVHFSLPFRRWYDNLVHT